MTLPLKNYIQITRAQIFEVSLEGFQTHDDWIKGVLPSLESGVTVLPSHLENHPNVNLLTLAFFVASSSCLISACLVVKIILRTSIALIRATIVSKWPSSTWPLVKVDVILLTSPSTRQTISVFSRMTFYQASSDRQRQPVIEPHSNRRNLVRPLLPFVILSIVLHQ